MLMKRNKFAALMIRLHRPKYEIVFKIPHTSEEIRAMFKMDVVEREYRYGEVWLTEPDVYITIAGRDH